MRAVDGRALLSDGRPRPMLIDLLFSGDCFMPGEDYDAARPVIYRGMKMPAADKAAIVAIMAIAPQLSLIYDDY